MIPAKATAKVSIRLVPNQDSGESALCREVMGRGEYSAGIRIRSHEF